MDHIQISKVAGVKVDKGRKSYFGTLHILAHHLLFCAEGSDTEIWISYSTVQSVDRKAPSAQGLHSICVTCRNFQFVRLHIANERDATEVFASLQRLINIMTIEQTYAFSYQPDKPYPAGAKWRMFDPAKEFARLGVNTLTDQWRFTTLNENYEFSPTYPRCMVVPAKISDNVLRYTGKFRSKARIPALSYLHRPNMASITRSSQPLVGLKQNRSIQDEKLVEAIFSSCIKSRNASSAAASAPTNLIVDARPTANAMAQTALGAGTESVENYRDCQIVFLGIDNIHVVRDSLYKLTAVMNSVETGPVPKAQLHKSGWLKHIRHILDGSATMVKQVHLQNSHVLVHCSDGWDRTAQLCSLAEICLDPYYRTIEGFAVLIEKEWISFGHKFRDRCGHLSRESNSQPSHAASVGAQLQAARRNVSNSLTSVAKGQETLASVETAVPNSVAPREVSPVFTQFLDCVYQLWTQFPTHFEFSERLLSALHLHVYACQYGNFLFNCERELLTYRVPQTGKDIENATNSVWNHILHGNTDEYLNPLYVP
ncbi:Myotubularin-like phosphatase domain-containing protein, partial [Geranomyces variabilis]